jgi:hypothetical protein
MESWKYLAACGMFLSLAISISGVYDFITSMRRRRIRSEHRKQK